jgi:hypothetical protein
MPGPQSPEMNLPKPVAAFIVAANAGDLDALVATFAEHAMVNDQLREYWNRPAIAAWARREIIGQRLCVEVHKAVLNHDQTVVEAHVDGNFDKRGLPDPLVVTFYFSTRDDHVVQLVILRNEPND